MQILTFLKETFSIDAFFVEFYKIITSYSTQLHKNKLNIKLAKNYKYLKNKHLNRFQFIILLLAHLFQLAKQLKHTTKNIYYEKDSCTYSYRIRIRN